MSVSLCIFRLELSEGALIPKDFCTEFGTEGAMASLPEVIVVPSCSSMTQASEDLREKAIKCRGRRESKEIVIESYEMSPHDRDSSSSGKTFSEVVAGSSPPVNYDKLTSKSVTSSRKGKAFSSSCSDPSPCSSKEPSPPYLPIAETGSEALGSLGDVGERKRSKDQIHFVSGNPFVEVTHGILHLYKENQRTSLAAGVKRSVLVCLLGIPASITCGDLLQFLAPCHDAIDHIRIVRDNTPNQYMALLRFRTQLDADEFFRSYNGRRYHSLESEVCHVVYVSRVEVSQSEGTSVNAVNLGGLPLAGHTELPICAVCLERMDESVDGILTVLCNHSFHGACLAKWGDSRCPVCRCMQTPEAVGYNACCECKATESLWMCLICGHLGCGRYVQGHAYSHFVDTQHCYAMQLGNNRVWDYVGDNFVHRLAQNKADGKLVELQDGEDTEQLKEQDEKIDSIQLEYTYLLTSQLESQRRYFEELLQRQETQHIEQKQELERNLELAVNECKQLKEKVQNLTKEKQAQDKKITQFSTKLNKVLNDWREEKEINKGLALNQSVWQEKVTGLEKQLVQLRLEKSQEVQELKEQLRDVMFYMEAQQKIAQSTIKEELVEGQVVLPPTVNAGERKGGVRKKKR